ncbi:MAG TPA: hypothetical protein VF529_16875 [Solirubrobacteraceae bacterium]
MKGVAAVDDAARAGAAAVVLFAVAGFGLVRLWLPAELRRHELLWVLPVGACASGIELAALGYARVPFEANLAIVLAAGVGLAVAALRRAEGSPRPGVSIAHIAWPVWIGLLLVCVALVPMFRSGFATVVGDGSDAHLAAGTAAFLQDHHPTAVAPEEPVDRVPLVWRSKPPIYYPLAAVATLSGMETWEAFPVVAALLMALAAAGFFLLARDALGASLTGAAAGMALVGLDRVVLHTTDHPYFNQTWGFLTLPFALLLAWWAVRARTRGALALLALFLAVGAFAYPLALPIPLVALAALLWPERRRAAAAAKSLWRGPRSLIWIVPLAALLAYPAYGVIEKAVSAVAPVVDPSHSLANWGGDLLAYLPEHEFLALPTTTMLLLLGPPLAIAIALELRRQPRGLAVALGGVLVFGAVAALWFRNRDIGWYFHFKALAFTGPLAVLLAAVAVSRLRRGRALALGLLVWLAVLGAVDEMQATYPQTLPELTELTRLDDRLPADASVRLDVDPGSQLWVAYFLSGQPLCSQRPLLETSYPHVPISRKADYVLADLRMGKPYDAAGPALWKGRRYVLYRQIAGVPGVDFCSRRMHQTVTDVL